MGGGNGGAEIKGEGTRGLATLMNYLKEKPQCRRCSLSIYNLDLIESIVQSIVIVAGNGVSDSAPPRNRGCVMAGVRREQSNWLWRACLHHVRH